MRLTVAVTTDMIMALFFITYQNARLFYIQYLI